MTAIKQHSYLEDSKGNKSSKRLWGSIMMVNGIIMSICLFAWVLWRPEASYDSAIRVMETVLAMGTALLGIGVTEGFFNKKE